MMNEYQANETLSRDTSVIGESIPTDSTPEPSWELSRLEAYAKSQLAISGQAEQAALLQSHRSAVALFHAGWALSLIRDERKMSGHGAWSRWKTDNCLKDTTVNDAIRLFNGAKTEVALIGLGITEAKDKFVYPKKEADSEEKEADADSPEAASPATADVSGSTAMPMLVSGSKTDKSESLDFPNAGNFQRDDGGEAAVGEEGDTEENDVEEHEATNDEATNDEVVEEEADEFDPGTDEAPKNDPVTKPWFKVGTVIYEVAPFNTVLPPVIRRMTVKRVTDKSYLSKNGARFSRDSVIYDTQTEAKKRWETMIRERISDLEENLRTGPDICE